jgi:5-azacytidine-induced protein 1
LTFADALIEEKQALATKSEELSKEVQKLKDEYAKKMKYLEEAHARDIKQQKESWVSSEKIRRDKWIQEKTKLIKDQTVKSLEPEIQRMLSVRLIFSFFKETWDKLTFLFKKSNIKVI